MEWTRTSQSDATAIGSRRMIVPIASIAYVTTLQIRLVPKIDPSLLTIGSTAILVNAGTGMAVQNYFAGESVFGKIE